MKNWHLFICVASGLWGGLAIGLQTEYFTSNRYKPVQVSRIGVAIVCGRAATTIQCSRVQVAKRKCKHTKSDTQTPCHSPPPPQDVADACRTGAATDIIFGLALGYKVRGGPRGG